MFGTLLTLEPDKKSQASRSGMNHPSDHAGQSAAFTPTGGAEPQYHHPLADSDLHIKENFFESPKVPERVEDPDDTFLMIDEDEAMAPSPASSVSGSCSDLNELELPRPKLPKRKIHIKRAVEKAMAKNKKGKHLTKRAGSVAGSIFGVFGMVRGITGHKNFAAQYVSETCSETQFLDSSEEEFHLVNAEDVEEEAGCQPLDLEPEEFIDYASEIEFSPESEEDD